MSAPTLTHGSRGTADRSVVPRRRGARLKIVVLVVLTVLAACVVWMVWFSSMFAAREVRVVGVSDAQAAAVSAVAAIPVGTPLARLDTATAERAVAGLPWVASAEVRRGWPSEVVIAVVARIPVAVLAGGTGDRAVDADGVVFAPGMTSPKGLPRVRANEGPALEEAVAVLVSLPADLARKVVSLAATTRDDVTLELRSGDTVRWGSAAQPEFKADVLEALMTRKAEVYDVAAPELPTTFRPAR